MQYEIPVTFSEAFGDAKWIMAEKDAFPVIRKNFEIKSEILLAEIDILGFGTFVFYVNGKPGTEDLFLPLNSDFEVRENFPKSGEETAHRTYICHYDITHLLQKGTNTLAVLLGDGWYNGNYTDPAFGDKKLCYRMTVETVEGKSYIISDMTEKWHPSYVTGSVFNYGEQQDFSDWDDAFLKETCDDSGWKNVTEAKPLETVYYYSDCPKDKVISKVVPQVVSRKGDTVIYDTGCNFSGYPVLETVDGAGEIRVTFSEESADGALDEKHMHKQYFTVNAGGKSVVTHPQFTWLAFRYFQVEGKAKVKEVRKIHTDAAVDSSFESSDETLNWIYKTFINTQLSNMHGGIPSDCPHLERRGYTGDGELTCRAVMRCLDTEEFYAKWIEDISDCQDRKSGHVQNTAPYTHSGGGPGGWGAAIVFVPYEFWKYYGDDSKIRKLYPQMLHYFAYMESRSENNLVVKDVLGEWCLGEWCTPGPIQLPAAFVNTYFYVKAMEKTVEIAEYLGKTEDIPMLSERIAIRKRAIELAYFNENARDKNFMGNVQGANAFGLDIGLGDEVTKEKLIRHYEELGCYDTGIFGTDIVTRKLLEYGRGDIVFRMLTATEPRGFGRWKKEGATSFWEYWDNARSHSHPMFGAVVAYFFEYILGIRYSVEGKKPVVKIEPVDIPQLDWVKGHITTPYGRISVSRAKENGEWKTVAEVPGKIREIKE